MRALKVNNNTLKVIRCSTGNQCSSIKDGANVRSPRLPSYKVCSAVLNALELLNHILRWPEQQRVTIVKSTSNISMDEDLCALRSQIRSNLRNIPKMNLGRLTNGTHMLIQ